MLHPEVAGAPPLEMVLPQSLSHPSVSNIKRLRTTCLDCEDLQHSPLYSTPARMYPEALQAAVHKATVMLAPGILPTPYVRVRPVVPSLRLERSGQRRRPAVGLKPPPWQLSQRIADRAGLTRNIPHNPTLPHQDLVADRPPTGCKTW
jgi:hypothetical protein